ncbi:MAG: toprim domain-containing protein [Sulfurimonadaceae bacterium]
MREAVTSALMSLGYEIDRTWKFALRKGERTPSAVVNQDGRVHDFGSGFHGDLGDILQEFHGMPKAEAFKEMKRLLGEPVTLDFSKFEKSVGELDERPLPDSFMLPHRVDRDHNRQAYLAELKQLFLGEYQGEKMLAAEWSKILDVAKKYDIGFNKKSGRLIMAIRDVDGQIRTFWKYKKRGADYVRDDGKVIKHKKVLYTKNKPRPPFAVQDLVEFAKTPNIPVLITEGEKDAMVANANGQRAVCIGGAGASKSIKEEYLKLFKGLNLIICGDYDEAGVKFNMNLLEQLKPIAKSVTVLRWEKKAKEDGFQLHEKFDLADYFAWKVNKNG